MADTTFAQIEAALVTRLEGQLDYLVKCASYAGQIEEANDGLPVEAPACFVMFDGFERDSEMSDLCSHVGMARFSILVVADSYVGGTQNRTGEHGAYAIIDDVITALDDHSLDLTGFSGCGLTGVEMVRVDKLRAMYKVSYEAKISVGR